MRSQSLGAAIDRVVANGNCSGCGACVQMHDDVSMGLTDEGFLRPRCGVEAVRCRDKSVVQSFEQICPGRTFNAAVGAEGSKYDPTLGPYLGLYEAWSTDDSIRHAGSSGGVITAITSWLVETGSAHAVLGARPSTQRPDRSVSLTLRTKSEVLGSAGSRYAPVSSLSSLDITPDTAFVGKPCEAGALRSLTAKSDGDPVIISFFCAGTPSQVATEKLLESAGIAPQETVELRYRGRGWPGSFFARDESGRTMSMSYEESWGRHLGRNVQWRCRLCPDGVGEHADLSVGDLWDADERGFPSFSDSAGRSVVVVRNERGRDLFEAAVRAGIICARPVGADRVVSVQPLQRERRQTLAARLLARRAAGYRTPDYGGFHLWRRVLLDVQASCRFFLGTFKRSIAGRFRRAA